MTVELGDRAGKGATLSNLGSAHCSLGQFDKTFELFQKKLNVSVEVGDRAGEGRAYGYRWCLLPSRLV